jgi:hypothetical protein
VHEVELGEAATAAMAKLQELTDTMCACKDKACADETNDELSRWSEENAGRPAAARNTDRCRDEPDAGDRDPLRRVHGAFVRRPREIQALTQRTSVCVAKAGDEPTVTVDADGLALAPTMPLHDADAIMRHTYSGLGKYVVSGIQLDYVRAGGEIDPKYGKATFVLGIATPPDPGEDPDRPLGAPIVDAAPPPDVSGEQCPRFEWMRGARSRCARPSRTPGAHGERPTLP